MDKNMDCGYREISIQQRIRLNNFSIIIQTKIVIITINFFIPLCITHVSSRT